LKAQWEPPSQKLHDVEKCRDEREMGLTRWQDAARLSALTLGMVLVLVLPAPLLAQLPPPPPANLPDPLVFAGSNDYPPFQWLDENGTPQGFVVDLQNAIARQHGLQARHRLMEWDEAVEAVESGDADVVALFVSEDREARFSFTSPVYYVAHAIYAASPETVQRDHEDLAGMRVAVLNSGYAQNRLIESQPGVELVPAGDIRAALLAVAEGRADIAVVAGHTARHVISEDSLDIQQVSPPFWPRPYAFAVRQGRDDLHAWLEEQVSLQQATGTYFQIHANWLSELEWRPIDWRDHLRTVVWIALTLLVLAGLSYAWLWSLRRQVTHKTAQLSRELESRRLLQQELQYRVEYDTLTGLPNRDAFISKLDELIKASPGWSPTIALIQLDNLEQLITGFSHSVALELQKAFGSLLEAQEAQLVGHFGSGLFAMAARNPLEGNRVVERLTEPLKLGSVDLDPMFVVGVVNEAALQTGEGADEVIRRGVLAVSVARELHRRWVIYSPDLEPDVEDLLLLQDFHRHGTRDMFLEYQPKVDLASGRIQQAEALIRWRHPTLGLIPPGRFVPMLEHAGLTHWITRWVIEESSAMLQRTGLGDSGFCISVNLSPQDLMEPELIDFILQSVAQSRSPCSLWFEITETGLIHDPVRMRETLTHLHDAGARFSVDDFGTGYASLSYMSEFPVDEVKIDRSFVGAMLANERHFMIVRSTIALAHELGLPVTAEGVEDKATLEALAAMNCDTVQGFFFSRPLEEASLLSFLDTTLDDKLSGIAQRQASARPRDG